MVVCSSGQIVRSLKGLYVLAGIGRRTPGQYFVTDRKSRKATPESLRNTAESVHVSARFRYNRPNLGIADEGPYQPAALDGWMVVPNKPDETTATGPPGTFRWVFVGSGDPKLRDATTDVLPEAPLEGFELELLRLDPPSYSALYQDGVSRPPPSHVAHGIGSKSHPGVTVDVNSMV